MILSKKVFLGFISSLLVLGISDFLDAQALSSSIVIEKGKEHELETAFRSLFTKDAVGYVLYGNKPIYFNSFGDPKDIESKYSDDGYTFAMNKGLYTLSNASFKEKKFILKTYENKRYGGSDFLLVNKKALKKVISRHLSLFRERLGVNCDAEAVCEGILSQGLGFLQGHSLLLGIVLGYGKHNAHTWERNEELISEVDQNTALAQIYQMEDHLLAQKEYTRIIQEYAEQHKDKWGALIEDLKDYTGDPIEGVIVHFAYHSNSKESKKILKGYKKAQKKIDKLLKDKNFSHKVLKRMNS